MRVTLVLLLLLAAPLQAQSLQSGPISDPATGLGVTPPPGYQGALLQAGNGQAAEIGLRRPEEAQDTGCRIGFSNARAAPGSTQEELNAAARGADMDQRARNALSAVYDIQSSGPFEHAGILGLQLVTDIRSLPKIPLRAQEIRQLMVMLDTPKGRTTVVCVGEKADFEARLPEYLAIARAVAVPG